MKPGDPKAINELFDRVAPSYDLLNDLLSFGMHRIWKRKLLKWLEPAKGENWIDLCCGTGDLAFLLAKKVCPGGSVLGIDSALQPLVFAEKRSTKKTSLKISWLQLDALDTGLDSNQFDGVVMAYGLRNLVSPFDGLREIHRLLKPGAKAGILDFKRQVEGSFGYRFQKFYLKNIVVPVAANSGLKAEYAYLETSLRGFPAPEDQQRLGLDAGFAESKYYSLAAGQMGALLLRA